VRAAIAALAAVALLSLTAHSQPASRGGSAPAGARGLREPAWSPDGKRLAVAFLDRIFTVSPEGRDAKPLGPDIGAAQREPVWSGDGRVAFAMDGAVGFDIYVASCSRIEPPAEGNGTCTSRRRRTAGGARRNGSPIRTTTKCSRACRLTEDGWRSPPIARATKETSTSGR
jgi:hypothetical protein